ncbi:MAG: hypothetical protein LBQ51_00705 [Desulfovibrio sp.]|jgi:hypothetical protein|nr:hypothetical protein [Desulfovibrio sp.]
MEVLEVKCPKCESLCGVLMEERELSENTTLEGVEVECDKCGCEFSFDLAIDLLNKKTLN